MEIYQINYSDEALQDLRGIFEYISEELKAPEIAAAQVKRIRIRIRTLDTFPERYKSVDWEPWTKQEMHQMLVDNFVVFYIVEKESKSVQIVRIFYSKRNIPNIVNNNQ